MSYNDPFKPATETDTDKLIDCLVDEPNFLELLKEGIEGHFEGDDRQAAKFYRIFSAILQDISKNLNEAEEDSFEARRRVNGL